jgi:hypothetical protein
LPFVLNIQELSHA